MPEPHERGCEARVRMLSFASPARPWTRPRAAMAEVCWSDGSWSECEIRAWAHSGEGFAHIPTARKFSWLVALKFPRGLASWDHCYGYDPSFLRVVQLAGRASKPSCR